MSRLLLIASFFCVLLAGSAYAQSNSDHTGVNPSRALLEANDLVTLNFALTFERLGYNFYSFFLARYGPNDFGAYGGAPTYAYLQMIQQHEDAHQNLVASAITQHGGVPVGNCTYDFSSITSVDLFMQMATMIENTCTMALDGAAGAIFDKDLLQTAAALATVEGRHSSFLQYVTTAGNPSLNPAGNRRAYPYANYTLLGNAAGTGAGNGEGAFEIALTPQQVLDLIAAANPNLLRCPYNLTQPSILAIDFNVNSVETTANPTINDLNMNDLVALNYALTLENLEGTYYATYQNLFTADDFTSIGLSAYDFQAFNLIRDHEASHVTYLRSVIGLLGGTAVAACNYNFGIPTTFNSTYTVQDGLRAYIITARVFENLGVSAYDGAVNRITNKVLIQAATTVATVEARHAAYLNYLPITATNGQASNGPFYNNAGNPYPAAADTPLPPDQVLAQASGYITSCPGGTPVGPNILAVYPTQLPDTTASSSSSSSGTSGASSSAGGGRTTTSGTTTNGNTSAASVVEHASTMFVAALIALIIYM